MQDFRPPPTTEQPILRVGITGFSPDQLGTIARSLQRPAGFPVWRTSPFSEADAWMVNGSKVKVSSVGILRVLPGLPTEQSVKLDPSDVSHPVAFSTPIAAAEIEPRCTFNADSPPSVHAALLQFDQSLRHLRALFVLGGDIVRLGARLRHGIFHVSNRGSLLAVLDFRSGRAGVSPHAHPTDFADAQWDKRPLRASDIPQTFTHTSPAELAWTYARRSANDLLPPRYTDQIVYFRHAPKVPPRWVSDSQLLLLRELATEACTFTALQHRTGLSPEEVRGDLTCLYFAGAVTTTRSKAARTLQQPDSGRPHSSGTGMEPLDQTIRQPRFRADATVPGSLQYLRTRGLVEGFLRG